jgi:hypothetical protein
MPAFVTPRVTPFSQGLRQHWKIQVLLQQEKQAGENL